MDQEVRDKWIAALRSGEYTQAKEVLCTEDSNQMCCLGVLCDIMDPGGWNPDEDENGEQLRHTFALAGEEVIRPMFGLLTDQIADLVTKNDAGFTFDEIADYIEENL